MGGGRIGEMVFSDPPGSFGSLSEWEKMELEQSLRQGSERLKRKEKLQEIAILLGKEVSRRTTENQGEHND